MEAILQVFHCLQLVIIYQYWHQLSMLQVLHFQHLQVAVELLQQNKTLLFPVVPLLQILRSMHQLVLKFQQPVAADLLHQFLLLNQVAQFRIQLYMYA